jgi:hypothetical protein
MFVRRRLLRSPPQVRWAGGGLHGPVEAVGDGALEAAADVFVALDLACAPQLVGNGLWVAAHAGDGDDVQGSVEVPIAASVEPVSGVLSAAGFQWTDAGQSGEGGLVADPAAV